MEERTELKEKIDGFVEREMTREVVRELDRADEYPYELMNKFKELDLLGINIPIEYGGLGGDLVDVMIITKAICKRFASFSWVIGNVFLYGNEIIGVNGSKEQKMKYLPKLAKGELSFAFAITEPNAGSDAASIATKAVRGKDGYYIINGNKIFITGGGMCDYTVTFTRTAQDKYKGITAFLVSQKAKGYSTRKIEKFGFHGSNTAEINYDNVRVAPEDILGGEEEGLNRGWPQEMKLLNQERLTLSACALGLAEAAYEDALAYAIARLQKDGKRGAGLQVIQQQLADMATQLEAIKQLTSYAAWKEIRGMKPIKETSMSKYFAAETGKKIVMQGLDIMAEDGSSMKSDMQRYLRDILIMGIGGGTNEIQKNIISKMIGL